MLANFSKIMTGSLLPLLIFGAGAYFLFACGRYMPKIRQGKKGSGTPPWRALATALAGTLGVGNIAGVASAIAIGGPGAVFWMWVAAVFAMPLKFAEVTLGMCHRESDSAGRWHGGAMYYIKAACGGRMGRWAAGGFALLCLLLSLTLGSMVQTHAAAESLSAAFSIPPWAVGGGMALLAAVCLWRGAERVEKVCGWLIPPLCLFFAGMSLTVIFLRREMLPAAFAAILREAFAPAGGVGGAVGVLTSGALRMGVMRGLVSNEAGCGTAPIAHAASAAKSPAAQGMLGVAEVFVDTLLLCTLTALVVLTAGPMAGEGDGSAIALSAFSAVLGEGALPALSLSIAFFAFATLLCWSNYGSECLGYLTGSRRLGKLFPALFATAAFGGALFSPAFLWGTTDIVMALMTATNIAALLARRKEIKKAAREGAGERK